MNKRFILLILDGLGVGAMDDCKDVRPQDIGYNTVNSVVKNPDAFPNLNKLGLFNIANDKFKNNFASNGKFKLQHYGADTYFGHQEIMGSKPIKPKLSILNDNKDKIKKILDNNNVEYKFDKYFIVEDKIVIADNLEADYGQIINVSASTLETSFKKILKIANLVRSTVGNSRVIALGGTKSSIEKIQNSIKELPDKRVGLITSDSGIYDENYQCLHMGYGIDASKQIQNKLIKNNIDVSLIGKIQDIILGDNIWRKQAVKTNLVMNSIIQRMSEQKDGLIAATIQETDLAGHSQDKKLFYQKLKIVDYKIKTIINNLNDKDILLITADHGNDPTNGTNQHTREYTPLIMYSKSIEPKEIATRETLSDIAATINDYFNLDKFYNGNSILKDK